LGASLRCRLRSTVRVAVALLALLGTSLIAHGQQPATPAQPAPPSTTAQPATPQPAVPPGAMPGADTQPSAQPAASPIGDPVGSVATVTGKATDFRNGAPVTVLKAGDAVFKGDLLQTDESGSLAVTFDDDTTFRLGPGTSLEVSEFLFEQGGSKNSALFNVVRGSTAFVASLVAKTGDMKIATPTATLGIRGTTGLVDVPVGAAPGDVSIKLYPDANGTVGRIEVFGAGGAQLGTLSRGSTGFSIRPGAAGRFAAVPLQIPPQQAARDRAFVQQTFSAQRVGRQMVIQRRSQQPNLPQRPNHQRQPVQPGRQGQPTRPTQPNRQLQPNRPGQPSQPGQPGRRGQTEQPGAAPRAGQQNTQAPGSRPEQSAAPRRPAQQGQSTQDAQQAQPASPQGRPGLQGAPDLPRQPLRNQRRQQNPQQRPLRQRQDAR
jgi:hypothetical protein